MSEGSPTTAAGGQILGAAAVDSGSITVFDEVPSRLRFIDMWQPEPGGRLLQFVDYAKA